MTVKNPHFYLALLLAACSSAPASNFFRDVIGNYSLTGAGAEFFALTVPGSTISQSTIFTVDNAGRWTLSNRVYFTVHEALSPKQAVYLAVDSGRYFGAILDTRKTFMASTNTVARPGDVEFSFLVPIAIKK